MKMGILSCFAFTASAISNSVIAELKNLYANEDETEKVLFAYWVSKHTVGNSGEDINFHMPNGSCRLDTLYLGNVYIRLFGLAENRTTCFLCCITIVGPA